MKPINFSGLNSLELKTVKELPVKTIIKKDITELKKICAEKCNFSPQDYSVIFCKNQSNLYETIINAIVESYSNIVGVPHIISSTMEHNDILVILSKLVKKSLITVSYINADIYGSTPVNNIETSIKDNTAVVIVSYVNYLTGAINDIKSLKTLLVKKKIPLFSDCIYAYGKLNIMDLPDVFSIDFKQPDLCLLIVKNILFDGYKLKYYSDLMQDAAEKSLKINATNYKQVVKSFLSQKFNKQFITINLAKILLLRNYMISELNKQYNVVGQKVYYYNDIIDLNIIPSVNDIIIIADVTLENSVPDIISLVYMKHTAVTMVNKLKKNNILVYTSAPKAFENIGILPKWAKHVLTLSLSNCSKKDIITLVGCL